MLRVVFSTIVAMLYVWKDFIPCSMMLVVVHVKKLYYQDIYNFCMYVYLRMEVCQQRKSHVDLFTKGFPKGGDKYSISVRNNCRWEAIMFLHMFEEELSSLLCCRSLLAWYKDSHLGKYVDYY